MRNHRLALSAVLVLSATAAFAQTTSGDLVGIVKDATGAVVPSAAVTVKNEATGVTVPVTANGEGQFRASNLLPGKYDIEVNAAGFQVSRLNGVLVELNKTSTANLTLGAGATQTVEVSADAGAVLDTTTSNLSQTFSATELSNLPTASIGLGVLNTSLLSPGVASSGGLGIGTGPSVTGQRPRNNNFMIEGIDNNNKAITGPLVYAPNDAVGDFTLITGQFAPEFGHSSGGQFNGNIVSGTNKFHGKLYEYFQNRNLNAASVSQGTKIPNPRYDYNRYGGQLGGPIFRDKLFFFGNYERQTTGQNLSYYLCTPTASGLAALAALPSSYNLNAVNLAQYLKYTPAATLTGPGGAGLDASLDGVCGNQATGPQYATIFSGTTPSAIGYGSGTVFGSGASTNIALGNYLVSSPTFTNGDIVTTSVDFTPTTKDSFRGRYIYNKFATQDTAANLPVFFVSAPQKFHLIALSEYHTFTTNLTNEFRVGFNRYENTTPSGPFSYPGLDQFPNLTFNDQGLINYGPDGNAPQFTIQNLYQAVDNVSYTKGTHSIKIGFDGRKYISPQGFTQRARGDYQYNYLTEFLHDLTPTSFGERSTGNRTYYGDQTALYGYVNDTWRASQKLTLNYGLRYEFTSVPTGERAQALNSDASVAGLVDFHAPQPGYKNFAPRIGINFAPDDKTSVRAGFGIAYDVLFDNLGTLSFPPQYSSTNDVGSGMNKNPGDANFLAGGGLPPGMGGLQTFSSKAAQRAATSALIPDQVSPYAETYTLTIQRTIGSNYTAEIGYLGSRGIHLPVQNQINVQPRVTAANQLTTSVTGSRVIATPLTANNLAAINALSNIAPAWKAQNFTSKITSYQPFGGSNYNAFVANLTRRFQRGLQANLSYTWSKTMDDSTAEVFATVLTPRRPQDPRNVRNDYSRSALDRTHRLTLEAVYDLPYYKTSSNFLLKNLVGNWTVTPIYTYESPEYATVLNGLTANLDGDSGLYISRPMLNPNGGVKGTGSAVVPQYSSTLAVNCTTAVNPAFGIPTCAANTVGYIAVNPNAQYIQAGAGTLPTAGRNTLPIRPINNVDVSAYKRITFFDRYSVEFGAQAFNVLNHAQYIPGQVNNVTSTGYTTNTNFQTVTNALFNQPNKSFSNNARSMQLSGKFVF